MRVVISGSMKFFSDMKRCAELLIKNDIDTILPEEDNWDNISRDKINDYKKRVSTLHFSKISSADTDSILVVNKKREEIDNFIGANTFAEIAIAFYFNKKIFLLNDYYEPYSDELLAWGVIPLRGNLNKLIK